MKARVVAKMPLCNWIVCPTVYETDRGTFVVQGKLLKEEDKKGFTVPEDEDVVEVPSVLIDELIKTYKKD